MPSAMSSTPPPANGSAPLDSVAAILRGELPQGALAGMATTIGVVATDAALSKAMTSGEAEKIYAKWFMNPIPPKGLNLSMPLSDEMKALYKAPNDKAFE